MPGPLPPPSLGECSFDLVSKPEGQGEPTRQFDLLFDQTTAGL